MDLLKASAIEAPAARRLQLQRGVDVKKAAFKCHLMIATVAMMTRRVTSATAGLVAALAIAALAADV